MDLWSKGLGKRVLSLSLGERTGTGQRGARLEIEGIMHAPVYWGYEVRLDESDIVGLLDMLRKPEAVRFLATSRQRRRIFGAAAGSTVVFLGRSLRRLLGGGPAPVIPPTLATPLLVGAGATTALAGHEPGPDDVLLDETDDTEEVGADAGA